MQSRLAAVLFVLGASLLAGCGDKGSGGDDPPATLHTCPDGSTIDLSTIPGHDEEGFDPDSACAQQKPTYAVTVKVVSSAGAPYSNSEVYMIPVAQYDPTDPKTLGVGRYTDNNGELRIEFEEPTEVVFQVFGPQPLSFTREGGRLMVGETVEVLEGNTTAAGGTVTVPVYLGELEFTVTGTYGPANALPQANPDAPVVPDSQSFAITGFTDTDGNNLTLSPAEVAAYWSRFVSGDVTLAWSNEPPAYADLYAGWACGDTVVKSTPDTDVGPVPPGGNRQSTSLLDSATDEVPCLGEPVSVAALTDSIVVGATPLTFTGHAQFKGQYPAGMPLPPGCFPEGSIKCMGSPLPGLTELPGRTKA